MRPFLPEALVVWVQENPAHKAVCSLSFPLGSFVMTFSKSRIFCSLGFAYWHLAKVRILPDMLAVLFCVPITCYLQGQICFQYICGQISVWQNLLC